MLTSHDFQSSERFLDLGLTLFLCTLSLVFGSFINYWLFEILAAWDSALLSDLQNCWPLIAEVIPLSVDKKAERITPSFTEPSSKRCLTALAKLESPVTTTSSTVSWEPPAKKM